MTKNILSVFTIASIILTTLFTIPHINAETGSISTAETNPEYQKYIQLSDSAINYMNRERWEDACRTIKEALKLQPANPSNPLLFSNLGLCQYHLGDYRGALQSFDISLIKAPDSPIVLYNRARTHISDNNIKAAIDDLDHIIKTDSINLHARSLRANILLKINKPGDALEDFQYLDSISPDNAFTKIGIGRCMDLLDRGSEAYEHFEKAISLSQEPEIQLATIIHFISINNLNHADEIVREAIRLYPRDGMFYLYRAILHKLRYQNYDAELDLKMAKEYGVDPQTIDNTWSIF